MSSHLNLAHAYIAVRALDPSGAPVVPGAWAIEQSIDGWFVLRRASDGALVVAWRANSVGAEGLFAVFGPDDVLAALRALDATRIAPAQQLWSAAVAGNATAIAVCRRWPIWRFDGSTRLAAMSDPLVAVVGAARRLIFEGQSLPAPPLPTPAAPWRFALDGTIAATDLASFTRVTAITRPAFDRTLAGYALHSTAELELPV
jgi:hypothetical protein